MQILVGTAARGRPAQYMKEIGAVLPEGLKNAHFEFDLHDGDDDWDAAIEQCEALVLTSRGLGRRAVERASKLRFVQKLGIATERVAIDACAQRGIAVSVLPDAGHVAVAEHTLLTILAANRNLLPTVEALKRNDNPAGRVPLRTTQSLRYPNWLDWPENRFHLLQDQVLGLIGFGEIAREVALRARGFGLSVLYAKRTPLPQEIEASYDARFVPFDELLAQADIVSLHATQPDRMPPLLGAAQIARMKPGAMLINTARGNQVDEAALLGALRSGRLRAACLDVFQVEPALDNPLAGMPNVVATPHTAGVTFTGRRFADALRNIDSLRRGEAIRGLVR